MDALEDRQKEDAAHLARMQSEREAMERRAEAEASAARAFAEDSQNAAIQEGEAARAANDELEKKNQVKWTADRDRAKREARARRRAKESEIEA